MTNKLDQLIELERDMVNNDCHGNVKNKDIKLINKLHDEIKHDMLLANELRSTHNFYNVSKNGFCAGVTKQILDLSNYGGTPMSREDLS